jgi:hypothetical protein
MATTRTPVTSLLALVSQAPASDARADAWRTLVDESRVYMQQCQDALEAEFRIVDHERWDVDQDTGELVFSNDGVVALVARIQFVGSVSTTSGTWLWSWADDSIEPALYARTAEVREYGRWHRVDRLTEGHWPAAESDGWEMAAVANFLLKARGVYRAPFETGFSFLVITDIRKAPH